MRTLRRYACAVLIAALLFVFAASSLAVDDLGSEEAEKTLYTLMYTDTGGTIQCIGRDGRTAAESVRLYPAPVPAEPIDYEIDFGSPIRVTEYVDEYGREVVEELYYSPGPAPVSPTEYEVTFGDPIRVLEYTDKNGNEVVEELYFSPAAGTSGTITFSDDADDIIDVGGGSGGGWFENHKRLKNTSDTYIYVKAYFSWKSGTVAASSPIGWVEGLDNGITVVDEHTTTGYHSPLFGEKYAYGEYTIKTQNAYPYQSVQTDSVRVKVAAN